jgi:hypothetical protein
MTNAHFIAGFPPHQRFGALHPAASASPDGGLSLSQQASFEIMLQTAETTVSRRRWLTWLTITTGLLVVITLLLWLVFLQPIPPAIRAVAFPIKRPHLSLSRAVSDRLQRRTR